MGTVMWTGRINLRVTVSLRASIFQHDIRKQQLSPLQKEETRFTERIHHRLHARKKRKVLWMFWVRMIRSNSKQEQNNSSRNYSSFQGLKLNCKHSGWCMTFYLHFYRAKTLLIYAWKNNDCKVSTHHFRKYSIRIHQ